MILQKNNYQCDICSKQGNWDKNWSWYGSIKDWEDGKPIFHFCSQPCQNEFAERYDSETKKLLDKK